jgi:tetratricopeptide (TPR) repeat protein
MSSKIPLVRQIAWISIVPQLLVLGLIMLGWYQFNSSNFVLYGAINYLILSQVLRRSLSREHIKGMAKVKQAQFEEAILHFKRSYDFFEAHDWLDKYRFLTLLSSGSVSYKEMALNNIAFCYGQMGDGDRSKAYYQRTLDEFPDSQLAVVALRMLNSTTKDQKD